MTLAKLIALSTFLLAHPVLAQLPRVSTEAVTGCTDCDHGSANDFAEVIDIAARGGVFPLPKCMGIRSDRGGDGAWLARRAGGRYKHTGVDWYAPVGTPLRSPWSGTVIQSSYSKKAGHTVKVRHDNGYETVYMHLDKRAVKRGQKVRAGQNLGTVGKSGNASGKSILPHVHFELKKGGKRLNPGATFGCTKRR